MRLFIGYAALVISSPVWGAGLVLLWIFESASQALDDLAERTGKRRNKK